MAASKNICFWNLCKFFDALTAYFVHYVPSLFIFNFSEKGSFLVSSNLLFNLRAIKIELGLDSKVIHPMIVLDYFADI